MKIKNVALILVLLAFPVTVNAATWCNWLGTEGENCQSDTKGFIRTAEGLPVGVSTAGLNPRGWFELTDTQPTIGADQRRSDPIWAKVDNQITRTWDVEDLTAQEIQNRADELAAEEGLISRELYYFINCLLTNGSIDLVNGKLNPAPCIQPLKDAYAARGRLEAQ